MAGWLAAAADAQTLTEGVAPLPRPVVADTATDPVAAGMTGDGSRNAPLPRPIPDAVRGLSGETSGTGGVPPDAGGTAAATVAPVAAAPEGAAVAPSTQGQPPAAQPAQPAPAPPAAPPAAASQPQTPVEALRQAVLTVDQEAMYRRSRWGQRAASELAAETRKVAADNDSAFAALVAAEDALTAARPTLAPEEFRRRAAAFDERVTEVRRERDAARGALTARAERERALFFQSAAPVMGRVMYSRGALVVLDQRTLLISDQSIDATAAIIAALDAELGDGSAILAAAAEAADAADNAPPPPPADAADEAAGAASPSQAPQAPPGDAAPATAPQATPGDSPAPGAQDAPASPSPTRPTP